MENYDIVMDTYGDDFCTRHGVKKPPFPYNPGFEMLLLPHKPPQPVERPDVGLNLELAIERIKIHPLSRCFMHPPAAGTVISGEPLRLRIVAALEARDGRTSQLVMAETVSSSEQVHGGTTSAAGGGGHSDAAAMPGPQPCGVSWPPRPPPGEHIVAKVIDPLYQDHQQNEVDPFRLADAAYANEAAAYAKLAKLHGGLVPRYYGSYTFDLHAPPEAAARAVRVVLMEYVRGCALCHLDPAHFSQRARQRIIGDIIDAETAVFAAGVLHRDLYPRNVLVVRPLLASSSSDEAQRPSSSNLPVPRALAISATNDSSHEPGQKAINRPLLPFAGVGNAASPESGVGNGVGGRASSVVLIDFGKVSVQNDEAQSPFGTLFKFMGTHIPPLLRWHQFWWSDRQKLFEAWIDWEWQPCLEERYGHMQGDITDEMRNLWLPQETLERLQNSGGDADWDHDEDVLSSWWGHGTDGDRDGDELSKWCGHGVDGDHDEDGRSSVWGHDADGDRDEDELSRWCGHGANGDQDVYGRLSWRGHGADGDHDKVELSG
jgi:hypothetical protein